MNFLNSGILWALGLVSIPVIIHLINRRRAVEHRFAAFDFLMRSRIDTYRRFRLRSLLLLIVRTLLILCLVMAAAMPVFYSGDLGKFASRDRESGLCVVFDNSAGMRVKPDSLSDFTAGKRFLARVLEQEDAARVVLFPLVGPEREMERNPLSGEWPEGLKSLAPSYGAGNMAALLERVRARMEKERQWPRLLIVSDFALSGWAGVGDSVFKGLDVKVILARTAAPGGAVNAALTGLSVRPEKEGARGGSSTLMLEAYNAGRAPLVNAPLTLSLSGPDLITTFVNAEPGKTALKEFVLDHASPPSPGAARLAPDSLNCDNARYFVYSPPLPVGALLVDGEQGAHYTASETFFLERALSDEGSGKGLVSVTPPENFTQPLLKDKKALFICNVVPSLSQMESIGAFVKKGGGLFVSLGDRVSVDEFNARLAPLFTRALRDRKRGFGHEDAGVSFLSTQDLTHPAVAVLGKIEDPENYRFTDLFLMEPSPDSRAQTLLSLSSGEPLLLTLPVGKGRAFLYLSTLDLGWNNFPLRPFFLPFVRGLAAFMAGNEQSPLQKSYTVGDTVRIASEGMVTVENPSGRRFFFLPETGSVCFGEALEPGIYSVRKERQKEGWFAVNLDPGESFPQAAPPERLEGIFAGVPFVLVDVRSSPGGDILKPRPLWAHFLFGALVLVLLESLLCSALGRKPKTGEAVSRDMA